MDKILNMDYEKIVSYLEELKKEKTVVATSGYFDPLHHGHVELFKLSKQLGDHLIVVINNDNQTKQKKGYVFMAADEKAKIISELGCVDDVFISIDEDTTQRKTLEFLKPHIFSKGGDRYVGEIPETPVCRKHNIQVIDGVGSKVQSSSELIRRAREFQEKIKKNPSSNKV